MSFALTVVSGWGNLVDVPFTLPCPGASRMPKVWPYFIGILALITTLLFADPARSQESTPTQDHILQTASMAGGLVACGGSFPDEEAYENAFDTVMERIVAKIEALGLTRSPFDAFVVQVLTSAAQTGVWVERVGGEFNMNPVRDSRVACDDLVRRSLLYTQEPM